MPALVDPLLGTLGALWRAGWSLEELPGAWAARCPSCGRWLVRDDAELVLDLAVDHHGHCRPV